MKPQSRVRRWSLGVITSAVVCLWILSATLGTQAAKCVLQETVAKSKDLTLFPKLEAMAVGPCLIKVDYNYTIGFCGENGSRYYAWLPGIQCRQLWVSD